MLVAYVYGFVYVVLTVWISYMSYRSDKQYAKRSCIDGWIVVDWPYKIVYRLLTDHTISIASGWVSCSTISPAKKTNTNTHWRFS